MGSHSFDTVIFDFRSVVGRLAGRVENATLKFDKKKSRKLCPLSRFLVGLPESSKYSISAISSMFAADSWSSDQNGFHLCRNNLRGQKLQTRLVSSRFVLNDDWPAKSFLFLNKVKPYTQTHSSLTPVIRNHCPFLRTQIHASSHPT